MRTISGTAMVWFILCVANGPLCSWAAGNSSLLGARSLIDRVLAAEAKGPATNKTSDATPQTIYYADMARFTSNSATLPPDTAAVQWVAFYDRFWTLPTNIKDNIMSEEMRDDSQEAPHPKEIKDVLAAVPGPGTWAALLKIVEARPVATEHTDRELLLRMYAFYLNGKFDRVLEDLKLTTDALTKKNPDRVDQLRYTVRSLRGSLRDLSGDRFPGGMVAAFERQLDEITDLGNQTVEITIPDLLAFTDTNQSRRLIEKAIRLPNATLDVKGSDNTRALVRRVVMDHLSELRMPPWGLVGGADTIKLYEALTNKFPVKSVDADLNVDEDRNAMVRRSGDSDDWRTRNGRNEADAAYLWALVACGRLDEAVNLATGTRLPSLRDISYEDRHDLLGINHVAPQQIYVFLAKVLERKPETTAWSAFAAAALATGNTNEVLVKLRTYQQSAAGKTPSRIQTDMLNAYLTLDAVDDAVAILRQSVRIENKGVSSDLLERQVGEAQSVASRLEQLGRLLDRSDWINEGISLMRKLDTQAASRSWNQYGNDRPLSHVLINSKAYAEAEQVILQYMIEQKQLMANTRQEPRYYSERRNGMQSYLRKLVDIYAGMNRTADIVVLLQDAPWWGAADLQAADGSGYGYGGGDDELLPKVAEALLAAGQTHAAAAVAHESVRRAPGFDPGYQVLMKIDDPGLLSWLDARYARDKFEERPLIWKAALLLKRGRLEEAEQTIRLALKVDPTDGETRVGDRVRAYAVLADVLDARGKKDDAAFFRRVVEAVRVAEKGDELNAAGLVQRSQPLYEKASGLFADAYCVQWRLAERLWATGKREEAEKHYAIAFERMPEQFGQIAHLCFGCEGVFDKPESRGVAERVLMRLVQNGPPRAQVHFLIGQLREKQGRYSEAYREFRKSVEIDPGYLDGWTRLSEIANETAVSQADRDEMALVMLRLDPLSRHTHVDLGRVADLRSVWAIVEKNIALYEDPPASILPLPASAREVEEAKKRDAGNTHRRRMNYDFYSRSRERKNSYPGEVIASSQVVLNMLEFRNAVEQIGANEE